MLLILKVVLVLFIVRALLMLLRGVMQGVNPDGNAPLPKPRGGQLVRDPVCGLYVTPSRAITERSGMGTAYFCSEKCRAAWKGQ
jgi:YHS domain-containing protein